MKTYYNEIDKKKCAALSQLMKDGHITKGEIDDRSIRDVRPRDIKGYDRAHFFAGIGLWDYALQLAGWKEDQPVWTGSCPCQPFSSAGRQRGKEDDRHLWPEWLRLIKECQPATIFGEQVASAITKGWLDDVYQGLEAEDYAVGSVVLPASAVGAPHRRERLWFVADSECKQAYKKQQRPAENEGRRHTDMSCRRDMDSFWKSGIWIDCPDGKQRLVEPRIPLLGHGYPERVGLIHCAGDAIVPQVAAEFISAFLETNS